MKLEGQYRALLTPPVIEFASPQGKQLFAEAHQEGTMEGFFPLISCYQTQSEINYCGTGTLAMVLNALAVDPGRTWKGLGPWRWFDDTMLDCCESRSSKIKDEGVTFGEVACLAFCHGVNVEPFRTNESSLDEFRRHVISCAASENCHVISLYHRQIIKQMGIGHYSPIGGYNAGKDMVLILDVARFKYPPHWVPLTLLWEAMDTIDEETGRRRGFIILARTEKAPSVLYNVLRSMHHPLTKLAKYLTEDVPIQLKWNDVKDVENLLSVIFKSAPVDLKEFIKRVAEVLRQEDASVTLSEEEKGRLVIKEKVLKQIQETELFKHVNSWLASEISLRKVGYKRNLPEIAANVYCQGAELLTGKLILLAGTRYGETNETFLKDDEDRMLGPSALTVMQPFTGHVLTLLLLALPQHTWSVIKEENLLAQFNRLTSIDALPSLLLQQVLHLRRQLFIS